MSYGPELYLDEALSQRLKIIQWCEHCGEEIPKTKKLCDTCGTKAGRVEIDKQNREIFENAGLVFKCKFCENKN